MCNTTSLIYFLNFKLGTKHSWNMTFKLPLLSQSLVLLSKNNENFKMQLLQVKLHWQPEEQQQWPPRSQLGSGEADCTSGHLLPGHQQGEEDAEVSSSDPHITFSLHFTYSCCQVSQKNLLWENYNMNKKLFVLLFLFRMVNHSLTETYDNDTHFDLTFIICVWVTFLPTVSAF